MRLYAISDLHADFRENRARLDLLPRGEHRGDALIVAGDVADRMEVLEDTLGLLRDRFREVFFVPGNHELWVRGDPRDSVEKFHAVLDACTRLGVHTRPSRAAGCWVVPLFSWYDASFDVDGLAAGADLDAWSDFYFCRWPDAVDRPDEHFARLNEPNLRPYDAPVVTFSHFVPRPDLVPHPRWLSFKALPRVAGSLRIEEQLRRVGSTAHVFGHTHILEDRVIDGVRYVQNWLRPPAPGAGAGVVLKLLHETEDPPSESLLPLFC